MPLCQRHAKRIVDVDDAHGHAGQRKQARLSLAVRLHAAVVVEMIASQIGECRDPEANAIDPRLIERMRGDLHRRTACAELLHLRQLTLHRHRIGGRVFAGHHALGGYADTERTEIGAALTRAR